MSFRSSLFILLMVFITFTAAAQESNVLLTPDSDYYGFDLRTEMDMTLEQCQVECLADPSCRAFTHNGMNGRCFLKSDYSTIQPFPGATAGRIVEQTHGQDLGAPPRLDYLPTHIFDEAVQYRNELVRRVTPDATTGSSAQEQLARQALDSGNPIAAIEHFRAALANSPENSRAWAGLSAAARAAGGQDGVDRWQMQTSASSAALNAYLSSRRTTDRAEALQQLAYTLEWRQMYRPAINTYAASLELADNPSLRAQYEDLKQRQGFRIVDHTIDSDSRTPRICIQFSEPLVKTGVIYADFITIDGRAADNVTAGEREICVDGLQHGNRYRVQLRAGLPSSVGEILTETAALDLYIRDRSPSVRFTGDNFVLPAKGRHGVPVVTVNTARIELELHRIGERALANVLGGSQFLRQLDNYSLMTMASQNGEKIWEGRLETAVEQNREVVTSIPVDEALPERQPGVYVLTARTDGASPDIWDALATQWFVISDVGLSAISGEDGMLVLARSLSSAEPLSGIELQLVARNNDLLGETVTDAEGKVRFSAGLTRGSGGMAPQAVIAKGEDFVFLDLSRAGFDFSDRGVEGRPAPGAIDVMAWTERGIYRPGEEVHVTALMRDAGANAIEGLPLTFIFTRPDAVEFWRVASANSALGGHYLTLDLPENAMRGTWNLAIHADPDRPPLAERLFLVEDFVPDRIEFDLSTNLAALAPGEALQTKVEGRFLYGAPAAGLKMEAELDIRPTRQWDGFPGYFFGLDEEEEGERTRMLLGPLPMLDESGMAEFEVRLDNPPSTTALLVADISVRLREAGGRAVERRLSVPVLPQADAIGIAPSFSGGSVAENSEAAFRLIAIDPDGSRIAMPAARWSLVKIEQNFQWYRQGSGWNYEAVEYTTLAADGTIDVGAEEAAQLRVPVDWGRYRLEIESPDGLALTSIAFNAGWHVEARSNDTPDGLELALDRQTYLPGQVARLRVSPRFAGKLVVVAGSEEVLDTITAEIPAEGATVEIPIGEAWGAGAYLTATLYRPAGDDGARLPMRAIGVKWLRIDPAGRKLEVSLEAPEQVRPQGRMEIPVTVAGAGVGERAFVTLAAVDVGILNLTRYEAPDPDGWYFGQRRLGLQVRDLYGRLIDGSAGVPGRLRSGGDGPGMMSEGSHPTEKLVAFSSGIVELDADGKANIGFDLPRFNGTVRLMVVAWTASGVGHATEDVLVRDPVVVTASLPRFLAPGDAADMRLELALADAPAGDYRLSVTSSGAARADNGTRTLRLSDQNRSEVLVRLAADRPGTANVRISLEGQGGLRLEQVHELPVRPATMPMAQRMEIELATGGGSLRLDGGLFDGSYLDDASVTVSVAPLAAFDIPSLLMALDRYPYGCAEQVTSRAMPLLYVSELARNAGLESDPQAAQRVQEAIFRVLSNQSSSGSFGLWSPGNGDLWLDAYVADFLTRAREQEYSVPDTAMRLALDNLQNTLAYTNDLEAEGTAIAYSLYVLARNRRASAGDLRYYADTQLDAFASPMARAQIGASLALYGDSERAARAFHSALQTAEAEAGPNRDRNDYGSRLRDNAALLALAAESGQLQPEMTQLVSDSLADRRNTSTQEQAWMLLAARSSEAASTIELLIDGVEHSGNFARRLTGAELIASPLTLSNRADTPVTAVVTAIAAPEEPLPAGGNGFSIERNYYTLDGNPVNITEARQNERYVAVLRIIEENDWPSRVLVNDLLPAGLEIDNPSIVSSANLAGFDWLPEVQPAHLEYRDDRFIAAFDRNAGSPRELTLAYVVRAVTPGIYAHPAASVEDMYRPQFSARTAAGVMTVEAR